jgi:hypothetical protein
MDYCKKCNAEMVLNPKTGKYFCKAKCWLNAQPTKQDQINEAVKNKQDRIDKAIDIREKSIAFFNSTNSAIEMIKAFGGEGLDMKKELVLWREWFYSQWETWHNGENVNADSKWTEHKQAIYNQDSELETINAELETASEEENA